MRNRNLLIIFGALVLIYLLVQYFSSDRERTFDPLILKIDTARVSEIHIAPRAEHGEQIILRRIESGWLAILGDVTINTAAGKVNGLLKHLAGLESPRVVSRSPEQRIGYEVDTSGTHVRVFQGSRKVADFYIGAFRFDEARQSISSYVRHSDKNEIYLVDGFVSISFNQPFNSFRNSLLVNLIPADVRTMTLTTETGEQFGITKHEDDGQWYFAGMEQLDSASVEQYIQQVSNVHGTEYYDGEPPRTPLKSLRIDGDNFTDPVVVHCYAGEAGGQSFLLHAAANPETWFLSDSAGAYQRIFGSFEELLPISL